MTIHTLSKNTAIMLIGLISTSVYAIHGEDSLAHEINLEYYSAGGSFRWPEGFSITEYVSQPNDDADLKVQVYVPKAADYAFVKKVACSLDQNNYTGVGGQVKGEDLITYTSEPRRHRTECRIKWYNPGKNLVTSVANPGQINKNIGLPEFEVFGYHNDVRSRTAEGYTYPKEMLSMNMTIEYLQGRWIRYKNNTNRTNSTSNIPSQRSHNPLTRQ